MENQKSFNVLIIKDLKNEIEEVLVFSSAKVAWEKALEDASNYVEDFSEEKCSFFEEEYGFIVDELEYFIYQSEYVC